MTDVTPPQGYDPDERFTDAVPDEQPEEPFKAPPDEDDGDELEGGEA